MSAGEHYVINLVIERVDRETPALTTRTDTTKRQVHEVTRIVQHGDNLPDTIALATQLLDLIGKQVTS